MIRLKAADALLQAPRRIVPKSVDGISKDTEADAEQEEGSDIILEQLLEFAAEADTRNAGLEDLGLGLGALNDMEELLML